MNSKAVYFFSSDNWEITSVYSDNTFYIDDLDLEDAPLVPLSGN